MIPIRDEIPTRKFPIVNYLLIAANILVYVLFFLAGPNQEALVYEFAMIPANLTSGIDPGDIVYFYQPRFADSHGGGKRGSCSSLGCLPGFIPPQSRGDLHPAWFLPAHDGLAGKHRAGLVVHPAALQRFSLSGWTGCGWGGFLGACWRVCGWGTDRVVARSPS